MYVSINDKNTPMPVPGDACYTAQTAEKGLPVALAVCGALWENPADVLLCGQYHLSNTLWVWGYCQPARRRMISRGFQSLVPKTCCPKLVIGPHTDLIVLELAAIRDLSFGLCPIAITHSIHEHGVHCVG